MVAVTCVATVLDERRPLPVASLVREPIFTSTHAVTIGAPPEQGSPGIAQMGTGPTGWYGWDAIDHTGTPRGHRRIFVERTCAVAMLPRPRLVAFAT